MAARWLAMAMLVCAAVSAGAAEYSDLWGQNGELWTPQSRLPDFSYAGYRRGDAAIPNPAQTANVKTFGAVGDGVHDDTQAFKNAIAQTASGAIFIPAGRYVINDYIYIKKSNIVLRGAGPDSTTLYFPKSLTEVLPKPGSTSDGQPTTAYSFDYGFLTIQGSYRQVKLANITAEAKRGDDTITVSTTTGMAVGADVEVYMEDDAAKSLTKYLYSNEADSISDVPDTTGVLVAKIVSITGNRVKLDRYLPFDTKAAWTPELRTFNPSVVESGIENLRFEFKEKAYRGHFKEDGYNAAELRNCAHCWIRNVKIHNADSGIFVASRFCTVENVTFSATETRTSLVGTAGHHGIQTKNSEDNLVTNFHFPTVKYIHDITIERCFNTVFENGDGMDLVFDGHKRTPYACLFTNINIGAGNRPWNHSGGADRGRGFAGWDTFWNIRSAKPLNYPPLTFGPVSSLNFVGLPSMQAPSKIINGKWWEPIPPANLVPQNLRVAQLARRRQISNKKPTVAMTAPAASATVLAPATITLTATATDSDGTIEKVEFLANGAVVATERSLPYATSWTTSTAGTYTIAARATDDDGGVTTTGSVTITVVAISVTGFTLVDEVLADVAPLQNGDVITLAAPPADKLNFRANTNPATVGSVKFEITGDVMLARPENSAPYTAFATPTPALAAGDYTLTATPYTEINNGGLAGAPRTISFRVNRRPTIASPATATPNPSRVGDTVRFAVGGADADDDGLSVAWNYGDGTSGTGTTHTYTTAGQYTATATVSDGASSVPSSVVVTVKAVAAMTINFQPAGTAVPAGCLADSGAVFGDRGNGQTYGWSVDISATARERLSALSQDKLHDTLVHLQKPETPTAFWEIALPNGAYSVRAVAGDPSNFNSIYRINAENVLLINDTPTSTTRWFSRTQTVTVTVTDGRLTLSSAAGSENNKLCFVAITPVPVSGPPAAGARSDAEEDAETALEPLDVQALRANVGFDKAGRDVLKLTVALPGLPVDLKAAGLAFGLDVGGVGAAFTLDAKGKAKSAAGTVALAYSKKDGAWVAKIGLAKGAWAGSWVESGIGSGGGKGLRLPLGVAVGGMRFGGEKVIDVVAKNGVGAVK